jgi:hypothetical protein
MAIEYIENRIEIVSLEEVIKHLPKKNIINGIYIAEVDLDVEYRCFPSIEIMCSEMWVDWPANDIDEFIEEYRVEGQTIRAEHQRQYYVLESNEVAKEFLEQSITFVRNNHIDEGEDEDDE